MGSKKEESREKAAGGAGESPHPALKLRHTLRGHTGPVYRMALSPDGRILASPSDDKTVRLWDVESGHLLRTLEHAKGVICVAWSPDGTTLASGGSRLDKRVYLWDATTGQPIRILGGHDGAVNGVAWSPDGEVLASCSDDTTIHFWNPVSGGILRELKAQAGRTEAVAWSPDGRRLCSAPSLGGAVWLWDPETGEAIRAFQGHEASINSVAWSPDGRHIASGSHDRTVRIWDPETGQQEYVLEGHTGQVVSVSFLDEGRFLASLGANGMTIFWRTDTWTEAMRIDKIGNADFQANLAVHPTLPVMATPGSSEREIYIWDIDFTLLRGAEPAIPTVFYINAKAVLVGDTGVGKTGLSLVLNGQPYKETDSTAGRHVWTFDSQEAELGGKVVQTRETLLWDLAGQPGYRVIHQLHLNEVAVALVVFDARSETDPLAGVRHWERALRLARQRQGASAVPMKKFLVSARNDRGGVSIGEDRIEAILEEYGFDGYFKTSAKAGWQIEELRAAIAESIEWESLPKVSSSQLFADIKAFLMEAKETGQLLAPTGQLYDDFARRHPDAAEKETNLRDQFDTCIGRLENRDLIRRLTFGGYVLLQPELLDAYALAMVNAAKDEPDGLGSMAEEIALAGKFYVPPEQRVADAGQEQLLLHATVEELVQHDLALRENADDGRYLVFPSQFNRDYEDAPDPKGKAVAITFEGPVQSLYSTLAVRLGHSGVFSARRAEMWRNAAVFTAKAGGKCGLYLNEFAEARGRLILFYDERASAETRFHFEEFVAAHAARRALDGTVELVRFFVCPECGDPVPDNYVKRLREKGTTEFGCPCGGTVSLAEPIERVRFPSKVEAMDRSADRQRDFDRFVVSAKGETRTPSFLEWAGGERVTLAIVFTDVVGSMALGEAIRDEAMNEVRRAHFVQSRKLIAQFKGREIKTIGDEFMAAFKSVDAALDYARAFQADTGHPRVQIRAGIHIGPISVDEGDAFGGTVNFAARVVGAIEGAEIWLSERAKDDIDRLGAAKYERLGWQRRVGVEMKGFRGAFTLWSLKNPPG